MYNGSVFVVSTFSRGPKLKLMLLLLQVCQVLRLKFEAPKRISGHFRTILHVNYQCIASVRGKVFI